MNGNVRADVAVEVLLHKTGIINDPIGKTHSPASSNHYSHLKVVLVFLRDFEKWGRTDRRTDRQQV